MFSRQPLAPSDAVTITLDGAPIAARRGEALALALLAADKTIVARSPKLHRPRGPSCLRGGCDGCLARVDGVPNVMTCLVAARGGERIESQNVVGSRKADLLRVTDWFFPKGIDHHHLMAGVPGLGDVMQTFARKVAGLGRLPLEATPPRPARRIEVDAAVVGGGPAGIVIASRLARAGHKALLVDDGLALGGSLRGAPDLLASLLAEEPLDGAIVLDAHTAAGVYEGELLVASRESAAIVVPRAIVFATGAHDGVLAVPGNDLPGVMSARALCRVLDAGIEPSGDVAIVGSGFWADALVARLGARGVRVEESDLVSFQGTGGLKAITVRGGAKRKVVVAGVSLDGAPAFELAEQAGARIVHGRAGYRVEIDETGRTGPSLFAAGECTGVPFDLASIRARADAVAAAVDASLR